MFSSIRQTPLIKVSSPITRLVQTRFSSTLEELQKQFRSTSSSKKPLIDTSHILQQDERRRERLLSHKVQISPRDVAKNIRVTGVKAGRTIDVKGNNLNMALNNLKRATFTEKLKAVHRNQLFYTKPGKKLKERIMRNTQARFKERVVELMGIVREAKRKGY